MVESLLNYERFTYSGVYKRNVCYDPARKMQLNKILIIDDDEMTCFLHKRLLKDMQLAKEIAYMTDAPTALQHVKERYADAASKSLTGPDLILLDLDMPKMSGLQFMDELESLDLDRSKIFIVMMTASLDPKDRQKAEKSPFRLDGYYVKPLDRSKMDEILLFVAQKQEVDEEGSG